MTLYCYVVARDYGFAPNPFFGVCTLATCKPIIRKHAQIGDWVVGIGSKRYGLGRRLVYAMRVSETLSYDQYWSAPRFGQKRPNLHGSLKQAYGDNIYHHHSKSKEWVQEDSHHSHPGGRPNRANIEHDTQAPRVLVATEFTYWGAKGPKIPTEFLRGKENVSCGQGHKCRFSPAFVESFVSWIQSLGMRGYVSPPKEFFP